MEQLIEKLEAKLKVLADGIKFRKTSRYCIGQHDLIVEILKDIKGPKSEPVVLEDLDTNIEASNGASNEASNEATGEEE